MMYFDRAIVFFLSSGRYTGSESENYSFKMLAYFNLVTLSKVTHFEVHQCHFI